MQQVALKMEKENFMNGRKLKDLTINTSTPQALKDNPYTFSHSYGDYHFYKKKIYQKREGIHQRHKKSHKTNKHTQYIYIYI